MKEKIIFISFLLIALFTRDFAQNKPDWVINYQSGSQIADYEKYYSGLGFSKSDQETADKLAYNDFANSIQVEVKSRFENITTEKDAVVFEETELSRKQSSEIILRGINITARFYDEEKEIYYSLIKILKEDYDKLFKEELLREIARREIQLSELKKSNILSTEFMEEDRKQKEILLLEIEQKNNILELENKIRKMKHEKFLNVTTPERIIDVLSGEQYYASQLIAKVGISPLSIDKLGFGIAFWGIKLINEFDLLNNKIDRQTAYFYFPIFQEAGGINHYAISVGAGEYLTKLEQNLKGLSKRHLEKLKPSFFPFIASNLKMPEFYNTIISAYLDTRKVSFGAMNYAFINTYSDKISFILQFDYIYDVRSRNRFNEKVQLMPGIKFNWNEKNIFTFGYEKNEFFTFNIEKNF
ncbi:MAG: LPP20 family lipoprotein [Bacteroidetes bacterium]|nr:LPP20 family lipoprotein [Bacteroidota bacterium]